MAREATLFDESGGSAVRAYILLKAGGSANIPPNWIERARKSRKNREKEVAAVLAEGRIPDLLVVEEWEVAYRKECFYRGIRILLELDRQGKTKL